MAVKAVEIRNLSFSYPDGTKALEEISLDVSEGESLGIIGPNGAGKSTLLLQLNGILRSNSGSIKIFDFEVKEENLALIRKEVGLVFQDPDNQLFMPTVFDDVGFGPVNMGLPKNKVEEAVHQALEEVDMLELLQKNANHLSFGEKKRISLATVLAMQPKILALDEPTSNLDPKHRRGLLDFLKKLKITKIIASHDLELVLEVSSRVILLDKNKIAAAGETLKILSNEFLLTTHNLEVPASLLK
ncbi:MAG: cobalt ABC transporter ATP-binding protein [Candidatus Omnitrophota bacterium]|nr:MAG: cobalt ABC transporter ATP-binding protein [Candidatus Omnitrophota bacterium]